jgi:hypothetical protein
MDRMSLDLGTARNEHIVIMHKWKYMFIGECTGDVSLKLGSLTASPLDPGEFDKITGLEEYNFLYITNTAQAGKVLNFYFEEVEEKTPDVDIRKD